MKTFWTEATVHQNMKRLGFQNPQEYTLSIQTKLESSTGVKWSICRSNGGYAFHPIDEGISARDSVSDKDVTLIREAYEELPKDHTGYVNYQRMSEKADMRLSRLIPIIKWMEKNGMALRTVDRMGKGYAFKLLAEKLQTMKTTARQTLAQCRLILASNFADKPQKMLKCVKRSVVNGEDILDDEANEIRINAKHLADVEPEKLGKILRKIAKRGQLGLAVELMDELGILQYVLPEVAATKGVRQSPEHHQEGDVLTHIILAAKNAPSTVEGQFAALFHDIGKPYTQKITDDDVKFPDHDKKGAELARKILERFEFDEDIIDRVEMAVRNHMAVHDLANADDDEVKDFIDDVGEDNALEIVNTSKADEKGARPQGNDVDKVKRRVQEMTK